MARLPMRLPGEDGTHYAIRMARRPLRRVGLDIQRVAPKRRETLDQAFQQLRRIGTSPRTVVDVGVAGGTPELYAAFPAAHYLLVDAVAEHEPSLRKILEGVEGEYAIAAAASRPGTITMRVSQDAGQRWNSSIYSTPESGNWPEREVAAMRLDDLVEERGLSGPFLVKADTEGSELEVLGGAERVLTDTVAVVLEVGLGEWFEGAPRFADVVGFMDERGFAVYDIVGGFNSEPDGALVMVDLVFLPKA